MLAREAFASFFRDEYPHVVLYLRKIGASEAEAEDAAQEAMTDACRLWTQIEFPRAWVRTAAFRSYVRRRRALRRESPAPEVERLVDGRIGGREVTEQEGQWRVVAILRHLPMEQRKVAALYYDGFSCEEIADVVGKSTATVRSTLRHARVRLREVVLSEGFGFPGGSR